MEPIKYDGLVKIAVGDSRKSTSWKNKELLWSELAQKLELVTRTRETAAEYKLMAKPKRDELKDVGGFVGGVIKGGRRKAEAVESRRLLTLDLDNLTPSDEVWGTVQLVFGCAAVLYSTHSHTDKAPRYRIVMPLSRETTPDEYMALSRRVANDIGIDLMDDTTYEPHRLMYWPSASMDAPYVFKCEDGPWIDVDEQLGRYHDWHDTTEWPVSTRKADIIQRLAKKQGDPTEKPGIVGAFCRVYDVETAIEQFLPETYVSCGDGRYTFAGGSTSGGLVVYEDGKFAYSHHSTDPAGGKLCNAFDLVRLHLFGEHDSDVAAGTPANRLPSFKEMCDIAIGDETVRTELAMTKLKDLSDQWDEVDEVDAAEWIGQLEIDDRGRFCGTINNVVLILMNDPEIKGKFYYDEFKSKAVVTGRLPWATTDMRTTDAWTDVDDAGLRWHLEVHYQIDSFNKIRDAVDLAFDRCKRHPVREYLEALTWDGVERADRLFIDYLGASDTEYVRTVTRKSLLGAVARIFRPGCKHDHMLVLVGPQGCHKSTTIAKMACGWFNDSLYTLQGKDAFEQLQGSWLIEMSEMAATRKAELEQIKQFMSKQSDNFRAAYGRRPEDHPRQCAFFGTTNDDEFLRDPTGSRRFWPVTVGTLGRTKWDDLTEEVVDQIWAEVVVRFKAGEVWYLDDRMEAEAKKVQDEHTELNGKQGLVEEFLEKEVPVEWNNYNLEQRLNFLAGSFGSFEGETKKRDRICALELWVELFHGDAKTFTGGQARELNGVLRRVKGWEPKTALGCGPYGKQRSFIRST